VVTNYTPPLCRASYVSCLKQNRRSKYIRMSRCSNRLVLLDSKHRLQILQRLLITLMSHTSCCPTTWSRQLTIESNSKWRHCHRCIYHSCVNSKFNSNIIAFQSKADHPQMCLFNYAPMILTLKLDLDLDILKEYLHTKNDVSRSRHSKV